MENVNNIAAYSRAKEKVKELKGFYYNLSCYLVVVPVLAIINLIYMPEFYWFLFSAGGWGAGVAAHAMIAFNRIPFVGGDWENRKIKQLMQKELHKGNSH